MLPADFDRWLTAPNRRPLVMGVLNVTPDSFSDGGRFSTVDAAVARAEDMVEAGADLIDIGGESTKPRSTRVEAIDQIVRISPVLKACRNLPTTFSVDTTRSLVAKTALDLGAAIVNDISAGCDDARMLPLVADRQCPVVLMHMKGQPATMQDQPAYEDVVAEVQSFLNERAKAFEAAGVAPHRILIDPGIGFGKTADHNWTLMGATSQLCRSGRPVLVGASRKGFIGKLTGRTDAADRVFGTAAAVAWVVTQGAAIVRVHDIAEMVDVVKVASALRDHLPPGLGQ
ncbi:MAG: dihydropteroate synthase [Phycisphaerales bacterium]|nr:dihydropteroate synthase [Phycisphaerales bacterium]